MSWLTKFYLALIGLILVCSSGMALSQTLPEFANGFAIKDFQTCEKNVAAACDSATSYDQYQLCLNKITAASYCKQFAALAKFVGFSHYNKFDVVNTYNHGKLYLLHLVRMGANYPGDYYIINSQGELVQVTAYSTTKNIDIKSAANYSSIIKDYPQAAIWGIVDELPQFVTLAQGKVRFIVRYEMLNGCHACARAGYANVAFDFSKNGKFIGTKLIALEKQKPVQ